jgi:peptidoglycan/LPS O-acetylase OafA/YrhL
MAAVVGVIGLIGMSFLPDVKTSALMYVFGGPAIGILTVFLIFFLRQVNTVPRFALPLLWLGTISYAAYLWNYPLTFWVRALAPDVWQILAVILTLVMATLSWFIVERPFNALKRRLNARAHLTELDPVFAAEKPGPSL